MIQTFVSVPPKLDSWLRSPDRKSPSPFGALADFVGADPVGSKLGSGGGTVGLLHQAWQADGHGRRLEDWIRADQRLVLHAGGESRRLPAYAAVGKALLPVPFTPPGQPTRFNQVLSDFQVPTYKQVMREAGPSAAVMVASGDVWLELDALTIPAISADIAGIGMRVTPEIAQHFGVFFVAKEGRGTPRIGAREQRVSFFLQKPTPKEIYRHAARYDFYVDTGLWLFSPTAVEFLFRRCGWVTNQQRFKGRSGHPQYLDLYTEIGSVLGEDTSAPQSLERLGWSRLTRSVIPLEEARFFHVGSSRQLLESYEHLAANGLDRARVFSSATPADRLENRPSLPVCMDGVASGATWILEGANIVTGTAGTAETLRLLQEQCVEFAPVDRERVILRPYSLDDTFRGPADGTGTICGQRASTWLERRGLPVSAADVFTLPLYPILRAADISQRWLDWFFSAQPDPAVTAEYAAAEKVSAAHVAARIDFDSYFALRSRGHTAVLLQQFESCLTTGDARVFDQDFGAVIAQAKRHRPLREWLLKHGKKLEARLSRPEFQSRLLMLLAELNVGQERDELKQEAYRRLQQSVLTSAWFPRADPRLALKEDQIVWSRSPVRLDLAGGWTDTPPYCFEHGGAVLNLAVLLNGQPPIQVFVRPLPEPVINLRSIDLGAAEVIRTYAELSTFRDPRSGFSLPKAALAMAGFHNDYSAGRSVRTLRERLERFGGGMELSLLSAVPKGSGLGTSSILAATILGALNRACNLGWDEVGLYNRVLGVEQLLTTGGGWQDQAGALFRGIKLVETARGPSQTPSVRYLPQHLFSAPYANRTLLLYYTGITRLAKGILKEIVHDMFLARFDTLQTLRLIRANAHALFGAVQKNDPGQLGRCVSRSWQLNKQLDRGTSTPAIEKLLAACGSDLTAAKLLGAGGGGYMLLCARDSEAGERIRAKLEANPPNGRARFIDFEIADSGLEVTVS